MFQRSRTRRLQSVANSQACFSVEVVEPRVLLSGANPTLVAADLSDITAATRPLEVVAERWGKAPRIDEIRLVEDQVQVFATYDGYRTFPGDIVPLLDSGSTQSFFYPDLSISPSRSMPVTVTVPNRELEVVYFFAELDVPQSELYQLRTFGTSALLYRRADADGDSGWLTSDIDPGTGSSVELDFEPPPAAPGGLVSNFVSSTSQELTLWFDSSPAVPEPGQRLVRRYEISVQRDGFNSSTLTTLAFDGTRFSRIDSNGDVQRFGGNASMTLPSGVYSWRVRVQTLPVFAEQSSNVLASSWSEWSEAANFSILPAGQQILVGSATSDYSTGATTVKWGAIQNAQSYEVWIGRKGERTSVLHQAGLAGVSITTKPLDPGDYRVWVRATRHDGTRTSWSSFRDLRVLTPYVYPIVPSQPYDTTPTIEWQTESRIQQVRINLIDTIKEQQAMSIRFVSPEAYTQFVTAYSATVSGPIASHTVQTSLPASQYRIDLVASYANGTSTLPASGYFVIQTAGTPIRRTGNPQEIPSTNNSGDGVHWATEDGVASYDVWVAFLGGQPSPDQKNSPQWRFVTLENVTSGHYELAANAPGGSYRIWLRPNRLVNGTLEKGSWSNSTDITIAAPLLRQLNVTQNEQRLTWEAVPGAVSYRVTIDSVSRWLGSSTNRTFDVNDTEFRIPDSVMDGSYSVWVQSMDNVGIISPRLPFPLSIQHGTSSWMWEIRNDSETISWNSVPDAISYELELTDSRTGNLIVSQRTSSTSTPVPGENLIGHYHVRIRAERSVAGKVFKTEWETKDIDLGATAPSNIRLSGSLLTWDGTPNSEYVVTIGVEGGRLDPVSLKESLIDLPMLSPIPWFNGGPVPSTVVTTSANHLDLQSWITAFYSFESAVRLKVAIEARTLNPGSIPGDTLVAVSEPAMFTLQQNPTAFDPVVVVAPQPKPPTPGVLLDNDDRIRLVVSGDAGDSASGTTVFSTKNGASIDIEFIRRFELRVTNLLTNTSRTLTESQVPELMFLKDAAELSEWNNPRWLVPDDLSIPYPYVDLEGSSLSLAQHLGLEPGVYAFSARVQYLPVVLSANNSRHHKFLAAEAPDERINVAATPWSDWSLPIEHTVLPKGQSILPLQKSAITLNPRPVFAWGSNTANANYELWVENRITKQRVLHQTLTSVREFQATTDLPAGNYDWWVRIIGTNDQRNGWSEKQSIEILAPALNTSFASNTVDATPVISWTPISGAMSYAVILTSTTTGQVAYSASTAANTASHRISITLPNDTFTVNIHAVLPNGGRTAPGSLRDTGEIVLKRISIGLNPAAIEFTTSRVTWQAVPDATRYEVWMNFVDAQGRSERVLQELVYSAELALPDNFVSRIGEYRVWVRAIRNEAGQEYTSRWSPRASFTIAAAEISASALSAVMSELAITGLRFQT